MSVLMTDLSQPPLPGGLPDTVFAETALRRGVVARALSSYYSGPGSGNGLVLGYGMAEAKQIPVLVDRAFSPIGLQ